MRAYANAPPTNTGAMAPVSVLGRAASTHALRELVFTMSGNALRVGCLFVFTLPILDGQGVVGEEHGAKATTVVVLVLAVIVVTIIIIVDAESVALAIDGLTHILVAILIGERLEAVGLAIVGRKEVFVAVLHDVERVACGQIVTNVMVVASHLGHLCAQFDAEEEIAQTVLPIDNPVVVGIVCPEAIDIASAGDLSEILPIG